MKHDLRITLILILMFFLTQLIGLAVINAYSPQIQEVEKVTDEGIILENITIAQEIPFGMQPPKEIEKMSPSSRFTQIAISLFFAILIFLLLTKLRAELVIKTWFIIVIFVTMAISLNALFSYLPFNLIFSELALIITLPLVFYKAVKRNIVVHNLTELLIYPGLAAVFVPILNIFWCVILLLLISLWDIYAVWHSKIMVGMAKYQINKLKIFTGFFLPYANKKDMKKIKKFKVMEQRGKALKSDVKKKMSKIKVSLAILGGGDVAFPLIFAGIVMRALSLGHALIIVGCVTLSLLWLFIGAKKQKFYPAMPFLTAGCLVGYALSLMLLG